MLRMTANRPVTFLTRRAGTASGGFTTTTGLDYRLSTSSGQSHSYARSRSGYRHVRTHEHGTARAARFPASIGHTGRARMVCRQSRDGHRIATYPDAGQDSRRPIRRCREHVDGIVSPHVLRWLCPLFRAPRPLACVDHLASAAWSCGCLLALRSRQHSHSGTRSQRCSALRFASRSRFWFSDTVQAGGPPVPIGLPL
jgi:hypothetical protein